MTSRQLFLVLDSTLNSKTEAPSLCGCQGGCYVFRRFTVCSNYELSFPKKRPCSRSGQLTRLRELV